MTAIIVMTALVFFVIGIWQLLKKMIMWIFAPAKEQQMKIEIANVTDGTKINTETSMQEEQSIIVKDPYFNPNNIKGYSSENKPKKFIFRPETLGEYIGQDKAKALARLNLKKIMRLKFVHFLISGHRGCGKTTLAHILKNHLRAEMIERIAGEITNPDQIVDLVNQINNIENNYPILFIDEIHALNPKLCETFYPIMEDYRIAGKNIKPFILIGATTEKNILMKKVAPLVDRFQVQIELEKYSKEDIIAILKQYKLQLFPDIPVKDKTYDIIGENSKFVPRVAITLLEDSLIESDIKKVLECHRIVKDGLTDIDIAILKVLELANKPMGEKAISMSCGITNSDYNTVYEPYLVEKQFILRTNRGRILSNKGKEFLNELTGVKA